MESKLTIEFEQLLYLANQLPAPEKQRLITALQPTTASSVSQKGERVLGKYLC